MSPASEPVCFACDAPPAQCLCSLAREQILTWADRLRRAGLSAARRGEYHRARRALTRAVELDRLDTSAWKALGLVTLAVGDAMAARRAFREAARNGDPGAADWIRSLEEGAIGRGLAAYNAALEASRRSDLAEAEREVRCALDYLPDLLPARRLEGIIFAAQGRRDRARSVWSQAAADGTDDTDLLRLLGKAEAAVPAPPPVRHSGRSRARARQAGLGLAWAASVGLAVFVGRGREPSPEPREAPVVTSFRATPTAAPLPRAGADPVPNAPGETRSLNLAQYRLGSLAAREGEWADVVLHLAGATRSRPELYYRDDALYVLARAYARQARPEQARSAARQLLEEHPGSHFANSISRHLAQHGTEP